MRRVLTLLALAAMVSFVLAANVSARSTTGSGCLSGYQKTAAKGSLNKYDGNRDGVVCTKKGATTTDNIY